MNASQLFTIDSYIMNLYIIFLCLYENQSSENLVLPLAIHKTLLHTFLYKTLDSGLSTQLASLDSSTPHLSHFIFRPEPKLSDVQVTTSRQRLTTLATPSCFVLRNPAFLLHFLVTPFSCSGLFTRWYSGPSRCWWNTSCGKRITSG